MYFFFVIGNSSTSVVRCSYFLNNKMGVIVR